MGFIRILEVVLDLSKMQICLFCLLLVPDTLSQGQIRLREQLLLLTRVGINKGTSFHVAVFVANREGVCLKLFVMTCHLQRIGGSLWLKTGVLHPFLDGSIIITLHYGVGLNERLAHSALLLSLFPAMPVSVIVPYSKQVLVIVAFGEQNTRRILGSVAANFCWLHYYLSGILDGCRCVIDSGLINVYSHCDGE